MTIRIQNSLSKTKEELIPLEGKKIRMYSCGVTVYDQCHIGHARSLYIFDVIKRYLKYRGFDVHFVRNITDVDDKIINKAKETNKDSSVVAQENIDAYYEDLDALGIERADHEPRATDNIDGMIAHIETLIEKDYAYAIEGDVYYNVRAFKEYGKLSGQSVEKMQEAVRIDADEKKRDPLDFALWKKSADDEPGWDSPWGRGRPGWHIECSCMSMKHLDCQTLDIHAGGRDLIFPHHENEIAQSEAFTGVPFAKYWIHHGLLTIDGQKMAKSVGNFITIKDALKQYGVNELKFFFLSSHYGSPIDFTEEKILDAHKALERIKILISKGESVESNVSKESEMVLNYKQQIVEAMDDDFNTPKALGVIFELVSEVNKFIDTRKDDDCYVSTIVHAASIIKEFTSDIFGLSLVREQQLNAEEQGLLDERQRARDQKDFQRSDELRDQLKEMNIVVEDTKDGQVWRRA